MSKETAPCPECGDSSTVTKAGRVRVHSDRRGLAPWRGMNCPGSGRLLPAVDLMEKLKKSLERWMPTPEAHPIADSDIAAPVDAAPNHGLDTWEF